MPQAMVESPPDAGALAVHAQSCVPGLREGIQGRQKTSDESPFRTHSFPTPEAQEKAKRKVQNQTNQTAETER